MKKSLGLTAMLLLAGCAYSPDLLRQATFGKGTAFQDLLAMRYRDYANLEEERYNWNNAIHFADKGLLLVYGNDAGPEKLEDWNIPADALPALEDARARLMSVLTPKIIDKEPGLAARAQFNFDCWVDEQEKVWKTEDIAECRDGFNDAMSTLEKMAGKAPRKAAKAAQAKAEAKAEVKIDEEKKEAKRRIPESKAMPEDNVPSMEQPPVIKEKEPVKEPAKSEAKPEMKPEPEKKPEPKAETKPEAHPEAKPEAKAEPQVMAEVKAKPDADAEMVKNVAKSSGEVEAQAFVVLFEQGSDNPQSLGNKMIEEAANSAKGKASYDVTVSRRMGSSADATLFDRRFQVIKAKLAAAGLDPKFIHSKDEEKKAPSASYQMEVFVGE